jgi:hypothetical protein
VCSTIHKQGRSRIAGAMKFVRRVVVAGSSAVATKTLTAEEALHTRRGGRCRRCLPFCTFFCEHLFFLSGGKNSESVLCSVERFAFSLYESLARNQGVVVT